MVVMKRVYGVVIFGLVAFVSTEMRVGAKPADWSSIDVTLKDVGGELVGGGNSTGGVIPAEQNAPKPFITQSVGLRTEGAYLGVDGNANFALSSSQTLTFNEDGRSDKEVANSHSAVGGGANLIVGFDFPSFNAGPVPMQFATVMNFSWSDTSIETPFGMSTLHFDQNLYTIGVDGRLRFLTDSPFTPFVEGGVALGISQGSFRIDGGGANLPLGSATALAPVAQVGAGVDVKISGRWSLYIEGKAAIPMDDYNYRFNNVGGSAGTEASIKSTTAINLGVDVGFKINL